MLRWLSLAIILSLLSPVTCSADEHSGVAVFPAGSTTVEALFDAAVKLLEGSRVPVTFSDRRKGEIEASVTVYNTTSVAGAGPLQEDVRFWRLSFRGGSGGTIELKIARGSAVMLPSSEIAQFVRELAGAVKLDPAKVSLSLNEEARPDSQARILSQEGRPASRAASSGFDVDFCQFRVSPPIREIQADFIAKFSLEIGPDGSVKDIADITKLTKEDARRWGMSEEYIASSSRWLTWTSNEASAFGCLMSWRLPGVPPGGRVFAEFQWNHRAGWVSLRISGEGIDYKIRSSGCV
jgi:hypothetical protein